MRTVQTIIILACLLEAGGVQDAVAQQPVASGAAPVHGPAQDVGQSQTPPSKPAKKTKAAKAKPADKAAAQDAQGDAPKPVPPKSKLEPNKSVLVDVGYANWDLHGNESKFREYATPPTGIFLRDLEYAPILKSPSEDAKFELRGIGQDDYLAAGRGAWDYGETQLSGFLRHSEFFDPTIGPVPPSSWRSEGIDLRRAITRDFSLSFQERSNSQQLNYVSPYPGLDQNTDYWSALASGKLGRGSARLEFSNFHYADETQTLVNFDAQKIDLSYLWTPLKAVGIEAAASHVNIRQPDLPLSHVDTLSLGGDFALGAATDLAVQLQHRQVGVPTVQTSYARNENLGTFSLSHYFNSWRAQIGLRLQDDDQVNGTQTAVDVPKWSTLDGRLSGRLWRHVRVTIRGYTQSLSDPPPSVLTDTSTLYWTNRNFGQIRLESGRENLTGYLVYTYRSDRNSQRSTDVTTEQYTIGSTWQINPRLSLFAEFHHENWTGRTDSDVYPALNNFLPDSDNGVVDLNWNLGRRAYVSLNYTGFATYNDNPLLLPDGNTRGSFVTINTHYRFPAGYELGLLVAPWTYNDSVATALNYRSTVLMVTGNARF